MARSPVVCLALLLAASCGGGDSAPSVRSNSEEVQGRREEVKVAGESSADSSGEVMRLLRSMDDTDLEVRWRAEFALGRVSPYGIRSLADALRDENPRIRLAAAFVLGAQGKRAKPATTALIDALADKEGGVRTWAAQALGDIDPDDYRISSALTKALHDPLPDVRRVCLTILTRLGPRAAEAVPALIDLLQDADAGIRARSCVAFREIGPDGKAGIAALVARLADPDSIVRDRAAEALAKVGPDGVPALARALKERDPNVRRLAAEVLGAFGGESRSADAELNEAAKDPDAAVQKAATEALRRVKNDAGDAASMRGTTFIESPDAVARRSAGYKWAKFGLFVHWGIYSVPARAKPGQQSEWLMENEQLSVKEYEHFALNFGAENFNPAEWAKLANETGARYLVLTAKHHDGFCLWNSKLTPYSAARFAPAKRDLVGELAAACGKADVKFCAYYSLLDWHHPDYGPNFPKYVEYAHGQIGELLANYPLWGLWLDGEWGHTVDDWKGGDLITLLRQSKPDAFINDRLGRESRGTIAGVDFYTKETDVPATILRMQSRPTAWEAAQTFGHSWGYVESSDPLKSAERVIVEMVDAVSKGGNFLLNIGPRPDGTIPDALRERMKIIGAWLQKNGDSIYDTDRSPFNGRIPAGRVSVKGSRLFVFLEEYPKDGIITLPGLKTKIREAWVLDGKRELQVRDTGIQAPDLIEGSPVTVVAIELEGVPEVKK